MRLLLNLLLISCLSLISASAEEPYQITAKCTPMTEKPWVKQGFDVMGMQLLPNGNLLMFLAKNGDMSAYAVYRSKNCIFIEPGVPLGNIVTGEYRSEEPAAPDVTPRFPGLPNRGFAL